MERNRDEDLKEIIGAMRAPSAADKTLVEKAYDFAAEAHKDHKRNSGEPYLTHLVETGKELAAIGMEGKTIAAGLLHDSVEDVGVPLEKISEEFGKEICFLVDGVTKLGQFKYRGAERHRESLRKLLVATSRDARVLIIKLMDRLHNMRTLQYVPEEKRMRIATETLEIYAPIAHRLGMSEVRRELEDLAFRYAYPKEYEETELFMAEHEKEMRTRIADMERRLAAEFAKNKITNFQIDHRVKGLYSLWRKRQRKHVDPSGIHDIGALRVIVGSVADCYRALGVVHELWQPLPGKIKDYIAFPKPNGYRSLHTNVFSGDGGIVEVQIRTRQMHEEAQFGIAAHVMYKEGGEGGRRQSSFEWIKSLIPKVGVSRLLPASKKETKKNSPKNSEPVAAASEVAVTKRARPRRARERFALPGTPEWLEVLGEHGDDPDFELGIRSDFFSHRVFVFTPRGDVVDLPANSSPIDFAYAIHSDIGDHVAGAKVNGKMVPLHTALHNGDIVEIETKKSARPTHKWLELARTTLARRHIRNTLEREQKNSK